MLKVTRNNTFGQFYLEDQNGADLRIPRCKTQEFFSLAKLDPEDIRRLREGRELRLQGGLIKFAHLAG